MAENNFFQKNLFGNQPFDASESRANFGIYIGNQKHPKSSTWMYGVSYVFILGHILQEVG